MLAYSLLRNYIHQRTASRNPHELLPLVPQAEFSNPLPASLLSLLGETIKRCCTGKPSVTGMEFDSEADRQFWLTWPGEHYWFLSRLTEVLRPSISIEIGTYMGYGAIALAHGSASVTTYDISSVSTYSAIMGRRVEKFSNINCKIGDLADDAFFSQEQDLIASADLIFIDGPKNRSFEYKVIPEIIKIAKPGTVIILDDVRFANMKDLWASIIEPKIDVGSFAHSTGTGFLVKQSAY